MSSEPTEDNLGIGVFPLIYGECLHSSSIRFWLQWPREHTYTDIPTLNVEYANNSKCMMFVYRELFSEWNSDNTKYILVLEHIPIIIAHCAHYSVDGTGMESSPGSIQTVQTSTPGQGKSLLLLYGIRERQFSNMRRTTFNAMCTYGIPIHPKIVRDYIGWMIARFRICSNFQIDVWMLWCVTVTILINIYILWFLWVFIL